MFSNLLHGNSPSKACLKSRDLNWYFLCPRSKKYRNTGKASRATQHGYWKSTGNDRIVNFNNRPVGKIKNLIFHRGKPPKGERTDWVMHEYRLDDKILLEQGVAQDSYVICKIYEKSGIGPKNGENYGAPFVEEEWESDNDENLESYRGLVMQQPISENITHTLNDSVILNTVAGQNLAGPSTPSTVNKPLCGGIEDLPPVETEEEELNRLLEMLTEDDNGAEAFEDDIFIGLEYLCDGSFNYDMSEPLPKDCYLELNDLLD